MDLLMGTFSILWSFWPIMFLAVIEGAFRRNRKLSKASGSALNSLTIAWCFWLIIRTILVKTDQLTNLIIPEVFFWLTGIVLIIIHLFRFGSKIMSFQKRLSSVRNTSNMLNLAPDQFEQLVADTYRAFGNRVQVGGAQGDHGIDLIVTSPSGEKKAVQCKRWRGKVGEPVVRDFYGAMQHEGAVEGAIITAGTFTPQAVEWAKNKPIRLYDGAEFMKVVKRAQTRNSGGYQTSVPDIFFTSADNQETVSALPAANPYGPNSARKPLCPNCREPMVLRTARRGPSTGSQFWGCPNYPDCRETLPINNG